MENNNNYQTIYILTRPYLYEFLERVSNCYEIIIFTASPKNYAEMVIDLIDKNKIIKYKFYRENCIFFNNNYVKELKKLNRNMKNLIILDNNPNSYCLDFENGIPIKSFYDDLDDKELIQMSYVLEKLSKVNDVRPYIKEIVDMNQINYDRVYEIFKQRDNSFNFNNNNNKELNFINNSNNNKNQSLKIVKIEKISKSPLKKKEIAQNLLSWKNNSNSGKSFRERGGNSLETTKNNEIFYNQKQINQFATFKYNSKEKEKQIKIIPQINNDEDKINENNLLKKNTFEKQSIKKSILFKRPSSKDKKTINQERTYEIEKLEIAKRPASVIPLKVDNKNDKNKKIFKISNNKNNNNKENNNKENNNNNKENNNNNNNNNKNNINNKDNNINNKDNNSNNKLKNNKSKTQKLKNEINNNNKNNSKKINKSLENENNYKKTKTVNYFHKNKTSNLLNKNSYLKSYKTNNTEFKYIQSNSIPVTQRNSKEKDEIKFNGRNKIFNNTNYLFKPISKSYNKTNSKIIFTTTISKFGKTIDFKTLKKFK